MALKARQKPKIRLHFQLLTGVPLLIRIKKLGSSNLANVSNLDSVVCKGACVFLNSHGERIVHLKA